MKLADFKVGQKYKKISGIMDINVVYECTSSNGEHVYLTNPNDFSDGYRIYLEKSAKCFEPDFWIPKRGEVIQVGIDKQKRIFVTYIEGSFNPYVCVMGGDEGSFRTGKTFTVIPWKVAIPCREDKVEIKVNDVSIELTSDTKKKIMTLLGANK